MKKIVRIKESELVNLIDKIITETTRKQKISEGVRNLAGKQIIKEEYNYEQFKQFNDDINKGTPIKAKIKIGNEDGVITLTKLKKDENYKYSGVLSDNGGISSIQVLKGQNVILSNFPNTSVYNFISNTTGKEEIKTFVGMKNGIKFQFIEFVQEQSSSQQQPVSENLRIKNYFK